MNNQLVAVAHNIKLSQWNEIFSDRENSGLTIDEYCRQHELSKNAYYYWLRKCRESAIAECDNVFAEFVSPSLQDRPTSDGFYSQALLEINGVRISVSDSISESLLSMILKVSRNA